MWINSERRRQTLFFLCHAAEIFSLLTFCSQWARSWNNNNNRLIFSRRENIRSASREWKTNLMKKMAFSEHTIHFNLFIQSIMLFERHFNSSRIKTSTTLPHRNQVCLIFRNVIQQCKNLLRNYSRSGGVISGSASFSSKSTGLQLRCIRWISFY